MLRKHYILVFIFITQHIVSQHHKNSSLINDVISIKSEVLNETRKIQIYLPPNYHKSQTKFPVLYVVDAQRYFLNGIAFQQNLTWQNTIPEFIIVGIHTNNQKRRRLFDKNSTKFIQFLEKELIPKIKSDYNTLDETIYFGWEMAAGLGFEILANKPHLFKGYLLSSPTFLTADREKALNKTLAEKKLTTQRIYSVLGHKENWAIQSMKRIDSIFKKHSSAGTKWKFNLSKTDNHHTTPLTTINEGLKIFFNDYKPIRFYTINEFEKFGGIKSLKKHYENRGKRYQISTEIHEDTKHFLLLESMRENNFSLFEKFIKEFNGYHLIKEYYSNPRWYRRYVLFYLKNKKLKDAEEVLNIGMNKYPNSSILFFTKGNFYKELGKPNLQKFWYQKAIEIAETKHEDELVFYQDALKKIQ